MTNIIAGIEKAILATEVRVAFFQGEEICTDVMIRESEQPLVKIQSVLGKMIQVI